MRRLARLFELGRYILYSCEKCNNVSTPREPIISDGKPPTVIVGRVLQTPWKDSVHRNTT